MQSFFLILQMCTQICFSKIAYQSRNVLDLNIFMAYTWFRQGHGLLPHLFCCVLCFAVSTFDTVNHHHETLINRLQSTHQLGEVAYLKSLLQLYVLARLIRSSYHGSCVLLHRSGIIFHSQFMTSFPSVHSGRTSKLHCSIKTLADQSTACASDSLACFYGLELQHVIIDMIRID